VVAKSGFRGPLRYWPAGSRRAIGWYGSSIAVCLLLRAGPAAACTLEPPEAYATDPDLRASDTTAPTPFTEVVARVERRDNRRCSGNVCTESSCPKQGYVELSFRAPTDDQARREIGYRIVWLEGSVPQGVRATLDRVWPLAPPAADGEGTLSFSMGFSEVEQLDAEIALVAVDPAGNESEPSEPIQLRFSGCTIPLGGTQCEAAQCSVRVLGAHGTRGTAGVAFGGFLGALACLYSLRRSLRDARGKRGS
jgi:hypothetical protein